MPSTLEPRAHGGVTPAELTALGIDPARVVDFSASTNPYGPTPAVLEAARAALIERYPDPTATPVRDALSAACRTGPDHIVVGAGATDLLWTLARVWLSHGAWVRVVEPTFSEFRAAAEAAGARVLECRAEARTGFTVDLDALAALRADALYLANPASPSGRTIAHDAILRLAGRLARTIIVLDESLLSLSERSDDAARPLPDNVVRVRSLAKDHGVPGLRIGYLLTSRERAAALERGRPAWSVGAPAQAAALAACAAGAFVAESRRRLLADRDRLIGELRTLGLAALPSEAHFFLVPVPDARALRERLLRHGVLVRDCSSFGLPRHVRMAARPAADCARLLAALRAEEACWRGR